MDLFTASPDPALAGSPLSGEAEYEPHHLSFHEDVRRSLIDDWKSMFGMGLMEALAPREPSPEPRQKASTAETAETRIVGKVLEGVDHIGEAAIRWIESLEDTLSGALRAPAAPLPMPVVKEEPAVPFLKLRDAAVSPSSSSGSDSTKIGTAHHHPDPQDFPTLASSSSPALPDRSAAYYDPDHGSLLADSSHLSASTDQSDIHDLVSSLQAQLAESQARYGKLQASCKLLARKCMKLRKENEELKVLDPMHSMLHSQLTALLADKSRLAQENEALCRENASLHELLAYASYGANQSDAGTCYSPTDSQELLEFHHHLLAEGHDLHTAPAGQLPDSHEEATCTAPPDHDAPADHPAQGHHGVAEPPHAEQPGGSLWEHITLAIGIGGASADDAAAPPPADVQPAASQKDVAASLPADSQPDGVQDGACNASPVKAASSHQGASSSPAPPPDSPPAAEQQQQGHASPQPHPESPEAPPAATCDEAAVGGLEGASAAQSEAAELPAASLDCPACFVPSEGQLPEVAGSLANGDGPLEGASCPASGGIPAGESETIPSSTEEAHGSPDSRKGRGKAGRKQKQAKTAAKQQAPPL